MSVQPFVTNLAARFREDPTTVLYLPVNINKGNHWALARYDVLSKWEFVSSLPDKVNRWGEVKEVCREISRFLEDMMSEAGVFPSATPLPNLQITEQLDDDGDSCGYLVLNAINHHIFNVALSDQSMPDKIRLNMFVLLGKESRRVHAEGVMVVEGDWDQQLTSSTIRDFEASFKSNSSGFHDLEDYQRMIRKRIETRELSPISFQRPPLPLHFTNAPHQNHGFQSGREAGVLGEEASIAEEVDDKHREQDDGGQDAGESTLTFSEHSKAAVSAGSSTSPASGSKEKQGLVEVLDLTNDSDPDEYDADSEEQLSGDRKRKRKGKKIQKRRGKRVKISGRVEQGGGELRV